ncbi:transport-associated [Pirellula staleyi DSM 6068]|uniref:Transport-associated n=1 Tax=Pirellula staleyi (strain ATCC 27377 / DSM 6068 / ICPB 4128) TaxID=530564 RepID=D2R997_PIRSD|nr:BON domain-containing protein [Pirellula staleyi]ADB17647.1 transport-associated [Pirellula staleyi DSM 6068]
MVGASSLTTADSDLCQVITTQLAETRRASLARLAVKVDQGCVTLRGRVGSFYERQIAITCCQSAAGVSLVIDHVEVAVN